MILLWLLSGGLFSHVKTHVLSFDGPISYTVLSISRSVDAFDLQVVMRFFSFFVLLHRDKQGSSRVERFCYTIWSKHSERGVGLSALKISKCHPLNYNK